ncbi:hypothetical protein MRX96_026110 [Rhipicephalus microplus]
MDMQIILDHYACASYVVDYVNKSDRGMSNLKRIVAEILKTNPNDDIEAVIRKLRVDILKGIEMSAQEAAWFLLKQDMSHKSRKVVYVPTCYPEERVRVRKTHAELEALPPGSTDVWKANLVQNSVGAHLAGLLAYCGLDRPSRTIVKKSTIRYESLRSLFTP